MIDSEIKIGIDVGKADRLDRGISVYTRNILNGFGQIGTYYHFVLLHYPDRVPEHNYGITNIDFEPLPYADTKNPWRTMLNEQILNPSLQKRLDLDVVWHPHNRSQFIVPVSYVCTLHDILAISQPELAKDYLGTADRKALYFSRTLSTNRADRVITISEFSRQEIVKHLNVDPSKIITIHNGIDRRIYKPNKGIDAWEKIKTAYGLPDRYLLTTGSYAPHKNLNVLVDAYNQSNLPKENVGLVMVGPNNATGYRVGYRQVSEHVQKLGISDRVKLLPSVPIDELITFYSNAELYAISSLYEGFGLTPLEAMGCEVPVVSSNSSSLPEVCGSAALFSDSLDASGFANHFNSLIGDNALRQSLIDEGKKQVEKFDWQTSARQTLEVLHQVAMSRK